MRTGERSLALFDRSRAWLARAELCDRQLRRFELYEHKWECVRNKPIRHRYVSRVEDSACSGELNILEWHDR